MKKNLFSFSLLLLLFPFAMQAQNLDSDAELYLADPDPRFHGEQVQTLQRFLLFHGMDIGPDGIDGWFGKDTHNALLNYQASEGFEVTGRIKIKDFSTPLIWSPLIQSFLFTGWPEGPFPGRENEGEILTPQPGKDFVYKSYFGALTIPLPEIKKMGYISFILSPDKRFLAAFNKDNTSVSLWDVLSGTMIELSLELTVKNGPCPYSPDNFTQFKGSGITWWMDPVKYDYARVTLVIFYSFMSPQKTVKTSLISVSPYIQTE
jgi:hypothetical protein